MSWEEKEYYPEFIASCSLPDSIEPSHLHSSLFSAAETDRAGERRTVRTLVSNKAAAASQPSQPGVGALTFTHTVLFHLRLSATTEDASSLTVKYRNFEGAELRANLVAGEEIQVPRY